MRDLRPLGAGELLDRAVTLFVRHFVPIVSVLAVVYVPFGIVEWLLIGPVLQHMETFNQSVAHGALPPPGADPFAMLGPGGGARFALMVVLQAVVMLLARTALVAALSRAYAGGSYTLGTVYALALRRWPAQLLTALLSGLLWFAVVVASMLAFFATLLLTALLGKVVGIVVAIVIALALFAAAFVIAAWIYIGAQLATVEVTDGASPVRAFTYGLSVAFGTATRWRALVAALVVGAVMMGAEILAATVGGVASALTHLTPLNIALGTVITIVLEGVVTAFIVVYAVDVKVRRQGLDLVLATA